MSLQDIARDEVFRAFELGLATIVDAAVQQRLRREAEPALWWAFHERMVELLPRWRVLARAHHRRMARRYEALTDARAMLALLLVTAP
jgi:hypothetical protein